MSVTLSAGNFLRRTSGALLDYRSNFTIAGWVKPTTALGSDNVIVFLSADTVPPPGNYASIITRFGGVLEIRASGAETASDPPITMTVGTAYHLALVRDGGTLRLYVNGVQACSTLFDQSASAAADALLFGSASIAGGAYPTGLEYSWWKAWSATLSPREILTEMHAQRAIRTANVFGVWAMDAAASAGTDLSGNGNHLTAVGTPTDGSTHGYAATLTDPDNSTITWDIYSPEPFTTGGHKLTEPAAKASVDDQAFALVWKDPPATDTGAEATPGTRLHGAMIDYLGNTAQGYDNKMDLVGYEDVRNVGRDLVLTGPVDISPGTRAYRQATGVISNALGSVADEGVEHFGILTVYRHDTPFTDGQSLVPGYAGATADPDFFVYGDILTARLPAFPLSAGVFTGPNIAAWTANVRRTTGPDNAAGGGARTIMARQSWGAYYQTHSRSGSAAACTLMSTHRNETVTAALVQYGIHVVGFLRNGMHWYGNPGHTTGRLEALIIAALLLDRQDWIDLAIWSAPGVKRIWESHSQHFTIRRMRSASASSVGTSPAPFQYGDLCSISTGGTCRWRGAAAGPLVWVSDETGGAIANGVTLTGPDGQTAVINGTPSAFTLHYGEGDYAANPAYEGRPEWHRVCWSNGQYGNGSNRCAIGSDITWTIPYRRGEDTSLIGLRMAAKWLLENYATNGIEDYGGPDPAAVFAYIPRFHAVEQTGGPEPPSEPGVSWPPNERGLSPPEVELFNALDWGAENSELTGELGAAALAPFAGTMTPGALLTAAFASATMAPPTGALAPGALLAGALPAATLAAATGALTATAAMTGAFGGVLLAAGAGTLTPGARLLGAMGGAALGASLGTLVSAGGGGGSSDPPAPRPRPMPVPREDKRRPRWKTFGGWH